MYKYMYIFYIYILYYIHTFMIYIHMYIYIYICAKKHIYNQIFITITLLLFIFIYTCYIYIYIIYMIHISYIYILYIYIYVFVCVCVCYMARLEDACILWLYSSQMIFFREGSIFQEKEVSCDLANPSFSLISTKYLERNRYVIFQHAYCSSIGFKQVGAKEVTIMFFQGCFVKLCILFYIILVFIVFVEGKHKVPYFILWHGANNIGKKISKVCDDYLTL